MMFIPTEGAYLLAIQSDANLWEYAYNKKVVLMSPPTSSAPCASRSTCGSGKTR